MIRKLAFDEVVEAIDGLSEDDQLQLMQLIQCRLAERGRQRVIAEVAEARKEFAAGKAKRLDLGELARDLQSTGLPLKQSCYRRSELMMRSTDCLRTRSASDPPGD